MYSFIERQLEEAARKGAFDNLPGAGRPIDLSENPWVAAEWRLAIKVLKDNRVVPEFVERRKEIEAIRAEMVRLKVARSRALFHAQVERLVAAVEGLNRSLARENQFVRGSLQLPPVDTEAEMRAFDGQESNP